MMASKGKICDSCAKEIAALNESIIEAQNLTFKVLCDLHKRLAYSSWLNILLSSVIAVICVARCFL